MYDIKVLLENEGITPEIRRAFIVYLAGHNRPISELLDPHIKDISGPYEDHFKGMTTDSVELAELVRIQESLACKLVSLMHADEKAFLVSITDGEPEWSHLGIDRLDELPALQWKLMNIRKMDEVKKADERDKLRAALQI